MNYYLDLTIKLVFYLIGLAGILLLLHTMGLNFKTSLRRLKAASVLKQNRVINFENPILSYYNQLLEATVRSYKPHLLSRVIYTQILLMLMFLLLLGLVTKSIIFTFVFSLLFSFGLPICLIYIRLIRIRASAQANIYEGTIRLLQAYQKNNNNMYFAIKEVSQLFSGDMKLVYTMLFMRITEKEERENAVKIFAFQVGDWGRNLSIAILKAFDGTDVTGILQDITTEMSHYEQSVRNAETEGTETAQLGWLPAIAAPIVFIINDQKMMIKNSFPYLLNTSLGIKALPLTIIAAFVGIIMAVMLAKPKRNI
jgi:hypothetical protein